ncbi:DUF433 domain-containing protein [Spirosoma sp. KNUC1025]|uniref:DUF433 domain-containing protein n=1 Tax=Spirosoma sp. KNUC1025 TaxID=2894082 RepID=UPI0038692108|nr:DUF433 domain-containing protein [Spirosoma sp. KNUC1025]
MEDYRNYISINPEIRFGKPCITGTRISVGDVLGWLGAGMTENQIIEDFPELTHEQIMACLLFAADRERNVKIVVSA